MSDVLEYDKSIVESLHHIEDILVNFSLQNYASVGAVMLARFTDKISVCAAVVWGTVLGFVFLLAICSNLYRYVVIYRMHEIIRDQWLLREQTELRSALYKDQGCQKFLTSAVPRWKAIPAILINAVPLVSAVSLALPYVRFWG